MLRCLRPSLSEAPLSLHSSSQSWQGNSADITPRSRSQHSPTFNLTRLYKYAVQTNSFSEVWSKFHPDSSSDTEIESEKLDGHKEQQLLAHLLRPSRDSVLEALQFARPGTLTRLVSAFFDHSEEASRLCLNLYHSVRRAQSLYSVLHDFLACLPLDSLSDSLTMSQCDQIFDVFLQFDHRKNPFPHPDSHNFSDMRCCFSQLKEQLDFHLCKSHRRVRLIRLACLPSKIIERELAHLAQLDAAKKGTYVLQNDLDTIARLLARLHTEVEDDKLLIQLGLKRGKDKHLIQEIAKQLCKNHLNFLNQPLDLEEHLCLCFTAINRARSLLLQEINLQQSRCS